MSARVVHALHPDGPDPTTGRPMTYCGDVNMGDHWPGQPYIAPVIAPDDTAPTGPGIVVNCPFCITRALIDVPGDASENQAEDSQ